MRQAEPQSGATILEILIALVVFGVTMVSAFALFASSQAAFNEEKGTAEVHQNARVAIEAIARELRMTGYDPSNVLSALTPDTGLRAARTDGASFAADLTGDGTLDLVTYSIKGSTLVREIASWGGSDFGTSAVSEVAEGVGLLGFTYFDEANQTIDAPVATSSLDKIRRIRIGLVANESVVGFQESFLLALDVHLRN